MTVDEMLARNARRLPHNPAVRYHDRTLTYAELYDRSLRLAAGLHARGVSRGDRVAVVMHNGIEAVESWFAALHLRAIAVPVNFRLTPREIAHILRDSGASAILTDQALQAATAEAASQVAFSGARISTAAEPIAGFTPYGEVFAEPWDGESPTEDDTAFLVYTSGTTGAPKGAELTHRNLVIHTFNYGGTLGIVEADEVVMSGMPQFHIGGIDILLYPFMAGGLSLIMDTGHFDAAEIVDVMEQNHVTTAVFVPTQVDEVCAVPGIADRKLALRRIAWGASNAPRSLLQRLNETFPGVGIYAIFGQTEMSAGTCMLPTHRYPEKLGSVGLPVMNVEVRIVDEQMNDVPAGDVGEIVYRGATVMKGYWNRPDATAEAFEGGWFHSGDLCRMDEDGFIYVVDRKKDMVISGGENIYCAEVEFAIATHPKVADVAVIGASHQRWGETPIAIVVPAEGDEPPTEAEIIEHTRGMLARYKAPTAVRIVEDLPRNTLGKVQKHILRREFGSAVR